jgi:hypothetical protein
MSNFKFQMVRNNKQPVMLNLFQHLQNNTDPEIVDPELNSGRGSEWQKRG